MKYSLPPVLRTALEEVFKSHIGKLKVDTEETEFIKFTSIKSETFYFMVSDINDYIYIDYFPSSIGDLIEGDGEIDLNKVELVARVFNDWINVTDEYLQPSPFYENNDPITKFYFDEIGPEFDILDPDRDYAPFKIEQQRLINIFLESALTHVDKRKEGGKEVIKLIEETKERLSRSTKSEVIQRIRKIVAKGFKMGLEVGEKLLVDFTTELTKKLIQGSL